jgi:hypothetical protein
MSEENKRTISGTQLEKRHEDFFEKRSEDLLFELALEYSEKKFDDYESRTDRNEVVALNVIIKPPCSTLLKLSKYLPPKYAKDLEQNISDMRLEHYDALAQKSIRQAKLIIFYYYLGLFWTGIKWVADRIKELLKQKPKLN